MKKKGSIKWILWQQNIEVVDEIFSTMFISATNCHDQLIKKMLLDNDFFFFLFTPTQRVFIFAALIMRLHPTRVSPGLYTLFPFLFYGTN